jgi:drug/metabolite transporter (DMT)-like permease
MHVVGEILCLTTALFWAVSVTLFRGPIAEHGARTVNLAKCCTGALLQGITVLALGLGGSILAAEPRDLLVLAFSGVVGLTVGDTALFAAVSRLGVHRTLLLQTLAPVFTALLAAFLIGELPTPRQGAGAAVVLVGVALVVAPRPRRRPQAPLALAAGAPPVRLAGIAAAVLAALGQGAGVVLAKQGMQGIPVVPASFVRLAAGALGLIVLALAGRRLQRVGALAGSRSTLTRLLPATCLGTYLALFLMMEGIARTAAALAAVLLATGPVFSLFIEAALERRAPEPRGLVGTLLAVAGVALLSWR